MCLEYCSVISTMEFYKTTTTDDTYPETKRGQMLVYIFKKIKAFRSGTTEYAITNRKTRGDIEVAPR